MALDPPDVLRGLPTPESLTDREKQVICLATRCRSDKEIAQLLDIQLSTVKTHLEHLRAKLRAHKRGLLVRYGVYHGLCPPFCRYCKSEECTIKPHP